MRRIWRTARGSSEVNCAAKRHGILADATAHCFQHQARQAGMQRITRHSRGIGDMQAVEQVLGCGDVGGRRFVQPFKRTESREAQSAKLQRGRGEIGTGDLRDVVGGAAHEIVQRIEPDRTPGRGAAGTARALVGGRLADAADLERRQAGPGRVARDARKAAIDHRGHAVDSDGALGDVGREDDLGLSEGATARSCSSGDWSPCSGSSSQSVPPGDRLRRPMGAADLGGAGQEDEHMAVEPGGAAVPAPRRPAASSGAAECGVYSMSSGYCRPSLRRRCSAAEVCARRARHRASRT